MVTLSTLLQVFGCLSAFLLLAMSFHSIPYLERWFLPITAIGGFLLLLSGPEVWPNSPIPKEWVDVFAQLPGILIVPIIASIPLGQFRAPHKPQTGAKSYEFFSLFLINGLITSVQILIGFTVHLLFMKHSAIYPLFGWELNLGLAGGHGTAAVVGQTLKEMEIPYWQLSQGITLTIATFGLIAGVSCGVILIHLAIRYGWVSPITSAASQPSLPSGPRPAPNSQSNATFHLAVIFSVSLLAFLIRGGLRKLEVPFLSTTPVWLYAILLMFAVNGILSKIPKLGALIVPKTKQNITNTLIDFTVVAGVGSIPLRAVSALILPISIMFVCGVAGTLLLFPLCEKFLSHSWFENAIASFGMNTGVFLSGLILLRLVDPNQRTSALANYTLSYPFIILLGFLLIPLQTKIVSVYGTVGMITFSAGLAVLFLLLSFGTLRKRKPREISPLPGS